jgi:hypothetical protein
MKIVIGATPKVFEVLDIEIVDGQRHPHVFAANWHLISPSTISCRVPHISACARGEGPTNRAA